MYTTNVLQINLPRFIRGIKVVRQRGHHYSTNGGYADVEESFRYVNRTGKHLTIHSRTGLRYRSKSAMFDAVRGLVIVREVRINRDTDVVYDRRVLGVSDPPSAEAVYINRSVLEQPDQSYFTQQYSILLMEYFIPLSEIEKDTNGIYLTELDIVVAIDFDGQGNHSIIHPYSEIADAAIMDNNFTPLKEGMDGIVPFGFLIVDHNGDLLPRYIRIGDNVYQIPTTRDQRLIEGFHVCTEKPYHKRSAVEPKDHRILSMENADKEFHLFTMYEEAMKEGIRTQTEIRLAELALREKETSVKGDEVDYRKENLKLQRELNDQKRQYEEDMRDYTRRREKRVEWLDVVKTALGIVTTGFLIYKAFKSK